MPHSKQPRRATRAQVRQFLAAAGYEGTPPDDLVTEYVEQVGAAGRPGLPRHRLAVHLTAQSPGWAAPSLEVFEDAWRQQQQARAEASSAARDNRHPRRREGDGLCRRRLGAHRRGTDLDRAGRRAGLVAGAAGPDHPPAGTRGSADLQHRAALASRSRESD